MQTELRQIQDGLRQKERHDDLSTKSKLEYARKALDNLKKNIFDVNDLCKLLCMFYFSVSINLL